MRRVHKAALVTVLLISMPLQAVDVYYQFQFNVFDSNGDFYYYPGLDIRVNVSNGHEHACFEFINNSDISSSVAGIYFDDGSLLGLSYLVDNDDMDPITGLYGHSDVDFSPDANPGDLPGGNNLVPPFVTSDESMRYFSTDSDPPVSPMGVGQDEWLQVHFDLLAGQSLDDVIAELEDGRLRIGIRILALPGGDSVSAVNSPESAFIPEPITICLLGLGALGLVRKRTR